MTGSAGLSIKGERGEIGPVGQKGEPSVGSLAGAAVLGAPGLPGPPGIPGLGIKGEKVWMLENVYVTDVNNECVLFRVIEVSMAIRD